jgi:hypothetical protein
MAGIDFQIKRAKTLERIRTEFRTTKINRANQSKSEVLRVENTKVLCPGK